ncbi:MAG: acriflavin resistance protein [Ruminococcaceae bacterium]|nr:acriflavin resistance protein [Oscillospiraceae bacterium]
MIPKFSAKRPLTVVVAVIAVIILGVISFINTTVDLLPSMDLPYAVVYTTYPGASPEKVETAVTKPLEQALSTTGGISSVSSISSENVSILIMEFAYSTNMDSAMIEINGKIDMVEPYFDDMVGTPTVMRINPDMIPVTIASIDLDGMDQAELSVFVEDNVIPALERIDGVASVNASGLVQNTLSITISSDKLEELNNRIKSELEDTFDDTEAMLNAAAGQLNDAKQQLTQQQQQFNDNVQNVEQGIAQINEALALMPDRAVLVGQRDNLQSGIAAIDAALLNPALTDEEKADLQTQRAGLESNLAAVNEAIATIDSLTTQLTTLLEAKEQLDASKDTALEQFEEAEKQLGEAQQQLNNGRWQFNEAKDQAFEQADVTKYITADMLNGILAADNFSMPAGYLTVDGVAHTVKVGDRFVSVEELESLELMDMKMDAVGVIKLSDVADIEFIDNAGESYAKINGNDGIILSLEKQSTFSTVEVSDAVADAIDNLMKKHEGLHITSLYDQGSYINIVINSVLQNLLMGGILAVLVLLIFLRNVRPTLIVAVSIPISIMFAVVLMYFSGVTMNLMSLAGLALGVGMLVDNSIVVIENTFRMRAEGADPHTAAVKGATQVAGAITASTLTTICVFLPIVFTEGLSRQLFTDMGLTIAYSLVASLIVALTVVPAMSKPILRNYKEHRQPLFELMSKGYSKALSGVLHVKFIAIAVAVALLIVATVGAFTTGLAFLPESDTSTVTATLEMEGDVTTEQLRDMSDKAVARIEAIEEVETVGAIEGSAVSVMSAGSGASSSVSFYILLDPNRSRTSMDICRELGTIGEELGCTITAQGSSIDVSALAGSGISISIKGNETDPMRQAAQELVDILHNVEGTTEVTDLDEGAAEELRVTIDKNKALGYGLTVAQVYADIADRLAEGSAATTITIDSVDYPVLVNDDSVQPLDLESLEGYVVGSFTDEDGKEQDVRLDDIADISSAKSLGSITRINQVRYMTVSAAIADGYNVSLVSRDLEALLKDYTLPAGVEIELQGENATIMETMGDLLLMVALAVALIYLIMVAQFQSLLSPFIVIFTIPLAFTGGLLALMLCGMEISVIAMLGFLVLAGVIVNNGIVLVDYTNILREEGMSKREALVTAGRTRLRPILMTAITTILGLSTLAFGIGEGADMLQPLAVVVIGGLIYATFMTLFIVPCLYDILNREKKTKTEEPALCEAAAAAALPAYDDAEIADESDELPESDDSWTDVFAEETAEGDSPLTDDAVEEAAAEVSDPATSDTL